MNRKMVFYMLGHIIMLEGVILILPALCSLIYGEKSFFAFLVAIAVALAVGGLLHFLNRKHDKTIFAKEGFVIVSLAWISLSLIGAIPYVVSGEIPSVADAVFESVSGITTTGASILENVELCSKGINFWRCFSNWIGGMGVLVLFMAIFPTESGRTMHIMRAEMPGPIVGKLVPKIKSTAKILYFIYIALTGLETVLLLTSGLSFYESLVLSFSTAGTGGFSVYADGLGSATVLQQWIVAIFMLIFGVNFNIYYLILIKKIRTAVKSEEIWTYFGIVLTATLLIAVNIYKTVGNFSDAIRHSFFQVSSIVTTTGFSTVDFNLWPSFSKAILFVLLFMGACAGSTAGGFKISRVVILFKSIKANLKKLIHTRSITSVTFEGKTLESGMMVNVLSYLAIYCLCFLAIFLIIGFEPFELETNLSAVATCFNNVGPGVNAVGPAGNFSAYTDFSKYLLSFAMLLGRLEIYPLLLLFAPSAWKKARTHKRS